MLMKSTLAALLLFSMPLLAAPLQICYEDNEHSPALPKQMVQGVAAYGTHSQTATLAFALAGVAVELHRIPWKRCLHEASIGKMDGVIGIGWTAERQQLLAFPLNALQQADASLSLMQVDYHIYTHQQQPLSWDGNRLSGVKFGLSAPQGFVVEQKLKQLNALSTLPSGLNAGLELVLNRRLDGYVLAEFVADAQLKQHPKAALIKKLQPPFYQQPLFLVFSLQFAKQQPEVMQKVWLQIPNARSTIAQEQTRATDLLLNPAEQQPNPNCCR
ncbi:MAG TPA: hypothetical protein DF774_17780 [Rheinheimera sp.]|nr:hypothetical protein [Rheinheimera sp.]